MKITNTKMLLVLSALTLLLITSGAIASAKAVHLDAANINPTDKQSLRHGSKLFVDYCIGCHSLSYMRYSRLATDLEISENDTYDQLIFTGAKFGDPIHNAMNADDAERWFGTQPPDLSLIARSRSVDWLYTYLRSFYHDPSRPWGVNNTVYKDVAMPHVLWELQGLQTRVENHTSLDEPNDSVVQSGLVLTDAGKQNSAQFDQTVRDIVNFLHYVAEPAKVKRQAMGKWVLGFLLILFVIVYLLKKEYWKDIH